MSRGLVYEVCVADTALGAIDEDFGANLIVDLAVALDPADVEAVDDRLRAAGVGLVSSTDAGRRP